MILYQVRVRGELQVGGLSGGESHHTIRSFCVFASHEEAEAYIPKFIEMCTQPLGSRDFYYLSRERLSVEIAELELVEEALCTGDDDECCSCCGSGLNVVQPCPTCGKLICDDCGDVHICDPE